MRNDLYDSERLFIVQVAYTGWQSPLSLSVMYTDIIVLATMSLNKVYSTFSSVANLVREDASVSPGRVRLY